MEQHLADKLRFDVLNKAIGKFHVALKETKPNKSPDHIKYKFEYEMFSLLYTGSICRREQGFYTKKGFENMNVTTLKLSIDGAINLHLRETKFPVWERLTFDIHLVPELVKAAQLYLPQGQDYHYVLLYNEHQQQLDFIAEEVNLAPWRLRERVVITFESSPPITPVSEDLWFPVVS